MTKKTKKVNFNNKDFVELEQIDVQKTYFDLNQLRILKADLENQLADVKAMIALLD